MNKRWIVVAIIAAAIGFALGGVGFTAIIGASDRQIEILKILAPFLALLAAWGMWLYDQRKRHDPYKQEVFRQRIAAYRRTMHAMAEVLLWTEGTATNQTHEGLLGILDSMKKVITTELPLMHDSVLHKMRNLLPIIRLLQQQGAAVADTVSKSKYHQRVLDIVGECLVEIRDVLGIEHADIDFDRWWR